MARNKNDDGRKRPEPSRRPAPRKTAARRLPARSAQADASRVKSEAVAMISHEFRTPMNAVLGMIDLLRLTDLTQKQRDYLHVIEASGNMLLSLVNNILDYSALDSGPLTLQRSEFAVSEIMDRVIDVTGYNVSSKGLEFAGSVECSLRLRVCGDLNRICQILINLVSNAVKFSNEGEIKLHIGADSTPEVTWLHFSVADRGVGMTELVKQTLFRPFSRPDPGMANREPGSGLGLAISKQLIEYMGGRIFVESEPGLGTTISFSVPVETASGTESPLDATLANRRLLLVSRSEALAESVRGYCAAWATECDSVARFDEALPKLARAARRGSPYDLVVADVSELRGSLAFARHIRTDATFAKLPILLLTPISTPLEPGVVTSIGNVVCVNKPVSPEYLEGALTTLLGQADEANEAAGELGEQAPLRILVAEDNPVSRQLLSDMLQSLGYTADCVADGKEALAAAQSEDYDILLLDGQMPEMDGPDVARVIRSQGNESSRLPLIVAITADASAAHRELCLEAGMDDFLAKPLRLAKLDTALRRWRALVLDQPTEAAWTAEADTLADQQARARLRELAVSNDGNFLQRYVDLFLTDTQERLGALMSAANEEDFRSVSRTAHALKGACLELGVLRMAGLCDALRRMAESSDAGQVRDTLQRLHRELERVRALFESEAGAKLSVP